MIWYVTYYYKHYKWLSSQYIYLLYFLNKLFVYLDFFYSKLFWEVSPRRYFYGSPKKSIIVKRRKTRFFYPVTSYLVNLAKTSIFFNLYYKTTLENFQNLGEKTPTPTPPLWSTFDKKFIKSMYYG